MKNIFSKAIIITSCTSFMYALSSPSNHVVTTNWLKQNISDKSLVIIDTRKNKEYKKGHIKGAINYPKSMYFQGKLGNIPKLPNTLEQMQSMLQKAGVHENSMIVFYSAGKLNKDFADSASGIWNTWLYGFKNTALLDGGFAKWTYEKNTISSSIPTPVQSELELESYDKSIIASRADIQEAIYNDDIQITDARVAKFYTGSDKRKDLARHGRIPTSKLTPVIRYVNDNKNYFTLVSKEIANKTLHNSGYGVELDKPLNIYCNTGHKARGLWFVSKFIIGMKDVKVYDGGIVEYSRTLLPMESGEAMD